MAMFLGEIAFLLELALFVAGLTLWHFGRQGSAAPLRAGGIVAMLGAVLTALCTGYFMVQYRVQGDFESAYPPRHAMCGAGMMEHGAMGHEIMKRHRMMMPMQEGEGMGAGVPSPEGEGEAPAHEEHHPEQVPQ